MNSRLKHLFGCILVCLAESSTWVLADELPPTVATGAKLEQLYQADRFFEGPSWDPHTNKLYFSSFPYSFDPKDPTQILRLDAPNKVTVWLDKSEGINGTRLSLDGRLLGAQVWSHRIMSYGIGPDGPTNSRILCSNDKLLQPNDVCQSPTGNIYFSDPDFENAQTGGVYLLRPHGEVCKIIDLPMPNGLVTSLDGKTLFVGEDHTDRWLAYPLKEDGTVGEMRVFFTPPPDKPGKGNSDGMTIDEFDNLYFAGECCFPGKGGIWVVSPEGKSLGRIAVPEFCSNVTFGGDVGKTLYLTCKGKLYSLQMTVRGGQFAHTAPENSKNTSHTGNVK